MPFPNLNDKSSLTSTPPTLNNYNSPSSYRDKVREKIQSSPRTNGNYQRSIDLTLSRENTFFRPSSRLRFSSDNLNNNNNNNNSNSNNNDSDDVINRRNVNTPSSTRNRQIVFYNKTYVPSTPEPNDNDTEICDDNSDSHNEAFNRDLDNIRRNNISRPNSRESFYQDNKLKIRSKSSYLNRSINSPNRSTNNSHNALNRSNDSNLESNENESNFLNSESNNNQRVKSSLNPNSRRFNNNSISVNNLNNDNNNNNNLATNNNNFDNIATRSINDFSLHSSSRTNLGEDEQRPVPKPRKRESINKLNMTLNDPEDFRIRRNNTSLISSRVVTPRIGYVPSPRIQNNNQLQQEQQINSNQSNDLYSKNMDNNNYNLDNKRLELTQEYVKFQTQKSPPIQKPANDMFINDMVKNSSRRSKSFNKLNPNISINFNNSSTDSFTIDSEKYEPNTRNWKKSPI